MGTATGTKFIAEDLKRGTTRVLTLNFTDSAAAGIDVSGEVFTLALKQRGATVLSLSDSSGIEHTATNQITITLTDAQTTALNTGIVSGSLVSLSAGTTTEWMQIEISIT